jgi:hypothetical protein
VVHTWSRATPKKIQDLISESMILKKAVAGLKMAHLRKVRNPARFYATAPFSGSFTAFYDDRCLVVGVLPRITLFEAKMVRTSPRSV